MLENHEKPGFTFFAFLPPYFGVSGFLVPGMRKISMRSIDWYQKFLISWLAARYSTVFVFYCRQNVKIDFLKFNLLPNEPIESFWDALWLGIRPFLCFIWIIIIRRCGGERQTDTHPHGQTEFLLFFGGCCSDRR